MPTTLTTAAVEESTFAITAAFKDEDGSAVSPNAGLTWTLTDKYGNVIHSRENVAIVSAASVVIVLHGDDLALRETEKYFNYPVARIVTLQGTYNSTLGSNLEIKDEVTFKVIPLRNVT